MSAPRKLDVKKPVKLVFTGGFLGSGKTTALAAIARQLIEKGKRVGIITNDQTENLVDTIIVRELLDELGVPIEEVVKDCFRVRDRSGNTKNGFFLKKFVLSTDYSSARPWSLRVLSLLKGRSIGRKGLPACCWDERPRDEEHIRQSKSRVPV